MKTLMTLLKKEFLAQWRGGQLFIVVLVFFVIGLMNTALALATPWMLEQIASQDNGLAIQVQAVEVTATMAWEQFFKNLPLAMLCFVFLESQLLTKEYQTGTLILVLTKGLKRSQFLLAKFIFLVSLWTGAYSICWLTTLTYTQYYLGSVNQDDLTLALLAWYGFGLLVVSLLLVASTLAASSSGVLVTLFASLLVFYVLSVFPQSKDYSPILLTEGKALLGEGLDFEDCRQAIYATAGLIMGSLCLSFPLFNRRQL